MSRSRLIALLAGLALLATSSACSSDGSNPDVPGSERPPADLTIARLSSSAPALESSTVTFWAVKGQGTEQKLYFLDEEGEQGEEYLSLKLDGESLDRRPDGSAIAEGDSVQITIHVEDPELVLFSLEPTGLKFTTGHEAELRIRYDHADDDLNDDGEVDDDDQRAETKLGIWRQESPGEDFVRLGTVKVQNQKQLRAELSGFSRYAIAY